MSILSQSLVQKSPGRSLNGLFLRFAKVGGQGWIRGADTRELGVHVAAEKVGRRGQLAQGRIRLFFLVERLLQKSCGVIQAEFLRLDDQRSIADYLVSPARGSLL
jgi:hypothetical protein